MPRKTDKLSPEEIHEWFERIQAMSYQEMLELYRSAPEGHPVFQADLPLFDMFRAEFIKRLGTPPSSSK